MSHRPARQSLLATLCIVSAATALTSCKKNEPIPPTGPPPPESQTSTSVPPNSANGASTTLPSTIPAPTNADSSATSTATEATIPATAQAAAKAAPDAASGGLDGAKIYQSYCQTCHGEHGAGDGPAAAALTPKPANLAKREFKLDPNKDGSHGELEDIVAVIRDGAAKYGGSPLMAPWPTLTKEQQDSVAKYVKELGAPE